MRRGCQLGRACALQQDRVGEPLDAFDGDPGGRGDLFDGRARPDLGLNLLGTQHAWNLGVGLGFTGGGLLATHSGTQSIVGPQEELLAGAVGLADDSFAIDVEPDDFEFPHVDLLRAMSRPI